MSNFGDLIKLGSYEQEVRFDCNDMTPLYDCLTHLVTYIITLTLFQRYLLTRIKLQPASPILKNLGSIS